MAGVIPSSNAWKRVAAAVRKVEGDKPAKLPKGEIPRTFNRMAAFSLSAIVSGCGGVYTGKPLMGNALEVEAATNLAVADLGTVATSADWQIWNPAEAGRPTHNLPLSRPVVCWILSYGTPDTAPVAVVIGAADTSGALFAVDVEQTGGAAGDDTTPCSYTYTVNSLDGQELATAAAVTWARPNGQMTAGTHGQAYRDADGDIVLYTVDEAPATFQCTE